MKSNTAQIRASAYSEGTHLVLAGAGTGKTFTMIRRIENTLPYAQKLKKKILILTFSRKAAEEIKQRLFKKNIASIESLYAGTIHSFCYDIICRNMSAYKQVWKAPGQPKIITDDDEMNLLYEHFSLNKSRYMGMPLKTVYSLYKLGPDKVKKIPVLSTNGELISNLQELFIRMDSVKSRMNLIGFSEIIDRAVTLIRTDKKISDSLSDMYFAAFIDEFQDTSETDMELIKLVMGINRNIFLVGDDYQAIYGFRGADVGIIMNLKKYFKNLTVHKLILNYRSHKEITDLAEKIIRHNRKKTRKKLVSVQGKGGSVNIHGADTAEAEQDVIRSILSSGHGRNKKTAILVRNNWQISCLNKHLHDYIGPKTEILTMHKSKGLEYERVIVSGINDEIFPSPMSDIEEERRLFFVAVTRAVKELHIIYHSDGIHIPKFISEIT